MFILGWLLDSGCLAGLRGCLLVLVIGVLCTCLLGLRGASCCSGAPLLGCVGLGRVGCSFCWVSAY